MTRQSDRFSRVAVLLAALALLSVVESACWAQAGQPGQNAPAPGAAPAGGDAVYRQQVSYMLGQNVGRDLKQNEIQCDIQSFMAGVADALSGAQPKWTEQQLATCRSRFEEEMRSKMMNRMQSAADTNKKAEAAFLAQNAKAEGVQTTPSGLQFKVLKQGAGATPGRTDRVSVHYRGTLLDGTEFDSSYGGDPASFRVNEVIPGWTEALQKMKVGDKWQLFVPSQLAYGATPPGPPIEPNSTLVFEVELLGVNGQ
ncbi:MAG: FKBP-type peptidyl-prolyl cis-trans isomerase [Pirellulales bacterium]